MPTLDPTQPVRREQAVKRNLIVVGLLAGMLGCATTEITPSPGVAAPVIQKDGWWIRVNTGKTEASSITFSLGTDSSNAQDWMTWRTGDAIEVDVPGDFRQVPNLYVRGVVNPQGKNGWFCINYRNHGVKHIDFDNTETAKVAQDDQDAACADFVR
jgi:hypothetical protein